jgi:hemerythrin
MRWSQSYESGLPEVDVQHQEMFELIQQIGALDDANAREQISGLLDELERVSREHFAHEERLMAQYDYPDLDKNVSSHQRLLLELQGYRASTVFGARKLTLVLSNWLLSHILMEDRPLALHIENCCRGRREDP